jgi:hypothetical protein
MKMLRILSCLVALFELGSCHADSGRDAYKSALSAADKAYENFEKNQTLAACEAAIKEKEQAIILCEKFIEKSNKEIEKTEKEAKIEKTNELLQKTKNENSQGQAMGPLVKQYIEKERKDVYRLKCEINELCEELAELAKRFGVATESEPRASKTEDKSDRAMQNISRKDVSKISGSVELQRISLNKLQAFAEKLKQPATTVEEGYNNSLIPDSANEKQPILKRDDSPESMSEGE